MRRWISVKEQRRKKNDDVAEVDKGRSFQREREPGTKVGMQSSKRGVVVSLC